MTTSKLENSNQRRLWATVLVFVIAAGFIGSKISTVNRELAMADGDTIISLQLAWSGERATKIVTAWGDDGLLDQAYSIIHWDWLFIFFYAVLLCTISELVRNARSLNKRDRSRQWLFIIPCGVALFDIFENLGIYYLLGGSDGLLFSVVTAGVALFASIKFLLLFIFIVIVLRARRVTFQVLSLARFSLLMLFIGIASLYVKQWEEVLLAVAENQELWLAFWLGFATLVAAITTWYSAYVMYMVEIPGQEKLSAQDTAPLLKQWLPRFLGASILALTAVGVVRSAGLATQALIWLGVAAVLYVVFVLFRHRLPGVDVGEFPDVLGSIKKGDPLPRSVKSVLIVIFALNLIAFFMVLINPRFTTGIGSAAVVLGAVGLIIPIGTYLVYWAARWRLPVLLILFSFATIVSLHNDNHWVRLTSGASSTDAAQNASFANTFSDELSGFNAYAKAWAKDRSNGVAPGASIPMFIVSAEGGGIRAAYWTAQVLAAIQKEDSNFSRHVFAISGVSGGSLGAAVFAAQVADDIPGNDYVAQADTLLGADFLAPTVATLLLPDLLQRFLPWPVFEDRAITMETSWEEAWRSTGKRSDRFRDKFTSLWSDSKAGAPSRVPLLFLNSTVMESGGRLLMHPLDFGESSKGGFEQVFKDAIDGRAALGSDLPLSTAVHLSARFTYVSPAGTVRNNAAPEKERPTWVRLVDGGYFENSGTVTSAELVVALQKLKKQPDDTDISRLKLFVIHISNDPQPLASEPPGTTKDHFLGEVMPPLLALLNARPARGYQARDLLFKMLSGTHPDTTIDDNYVHFQLYNTGIKLPLGWVLSGAARANMQAQLGIDENARQGVDDTTMVVARQKNGGHIERVLQILDKRTGQGGTQPDSKPVQ
jgi:predicted acylesterase/phospholipase RssA